MPIRLRLTLAFTGAAAVLLTLGIWLFVSLTSSALLSSIDAQLVTAAGLAGRYANTGSATPSPDGASGLQSAGEYLFQLVDTTGRVRFWSADAGRAPMLGTSDLQRARSTRVTATTRLDEEPTRVVAEPYTAHSGWTAVAAVSLEGYSRNVGSVETGAVTAGVVLIVIAAAGSYVLARRALTPVERMRREVAMLSTREDHSLIPMPRTNDELATLARTMNDLLARLHRALARERTLVADASHELRTPLAVLSGELELASRPGRTAAELRAAVASAGEEVERLNRLTGDLLFLARSDSGYMAIHREPANITSLLERAAQAAASRAESRRVQLEVRSQKGLRATVDADRLRQAVDNLIDNSLRVVPEHTVVELRADVGTRRLVVEVLDRGPGFPPEFLPVAFERFRRPDGNRGRDDGGSGLGLAIVQAVASAHGGRAEAWNRPGGGAAVRLEIPLPEDVHD